MTFEIIIFPGSFFVVVPLIAKLIQRRRDVLYSPYIQHRKDPLAKRRMDFRKPDQLSTEAFPVSPRRLRASVCLACAIVG